MKEPSTEQVNSVYRDYLNLYRLLEDHKASLSHDKFSLIRTMIASRFLSLHLLDFLDSKIDGES